MTALPVLAEETPAACQEIPVQEHYGKESQHGGSYFVLASLLEADGIDDFRLHYQIPDGLCLREALDIEGYENVSVFYAPPAKGFEQQLHYKIDAVKDGEQRSIVVIYNGMLAMSAELGYYVAEFRNDEILMYALYDDVPRYQDIRDMSVRILSGEFPPAVGLSWPEGSPEALLDGYDTKRLTK
ncbi:MAG: hypothetical protein EP340_07720 [Alphaproteobacteria bacterium]|nr:MAG: hypothetical protein EP340_07720 [Alphaproteobacteria bacterium]